MAAVIGNANDALEVVRYPLQKIGIALRALLHFKTLLQFTDGKSVLVVDLLFHVVTPLVG
jgi:hypothetical protein